MGNSIESNVGSEKPVAVVNPLPATESCESEQETDSFPKTNLGVQLFQYRQQISLKQHQVIKWATSKLLLTEELLKQQQEREQQQQQQGQQQQEQQLTGDAAWAASQLAMLTDDEDDAENRVPHDENDVLGIERSNLLSYRLQLRDTIIEMAQEKLRKREKTKVKRLKRRTLISSKKPSNKDKRRY
ncbi:protein hunchback [Drosophila grimshawi]|uniref:GH10297 n=1 Tax=Drosophila grimshawi TaxID=7222 RepID=B4JAE9_DROGR|nr:protein hunchback [Drosophila grimshawi]EDW03820.1 GH10297 [Drosophila grimshawi]